MRTRSLVLIALLASPVGLTAQGVRLPRGRGVPTPATLPPEIPAVNRALAYKRSRWSAEGYSLFSAVQVPSASGSGSATGAGAGTRGDYRFAQNFSATLDLTASFLGGFGSFQTAEVGTRYLLPARGYNFRPYFDLRAAFMHLNDTYVIPGGIDALPGGPSLQSTELSRYSRGAGGVFGAGFEYSITDNFALTTELSSLRSRMSTYKLTGVRSEQNGQSYWATTYRLAVGIKYNPVQALHLAQNPR